MLSDSEAQRCSDEGHRAYWAGKSMNDCPYERPDWTKKLKLDMDEIERVNWWMAGWKSASLASGPPPGITDERPK